MLYPPVTTGLDMLEPPYTNVLDMVNKNVTMALGMFQSHYTTVLDVLETPVTINQLQVEFRMCGEDLTHKRKFRKNGISKTNLE